MDQTNNNGTTTQLCDVRELIRDVVEADKFQTLANGCNVSGAVVDAWVHILNNDPAYRDPSLPRRLFCVHTTVVDWMLSLETDPSASRLSAFESGLKSSLCGREHLLDLKDIDMLFVPLVEEKHFYLLVFDLEREHIYLVDHMSNGESDVFLRDHVEYVLKTTPFKVVCD
ncbi:putative papain-like cysteine peptidase superfamily [Helianthus annuus]|nr:putative papain-like cysteine peptidase superfamily [Helianthus annuus]